MRALSVAIVAWSTLALAYNFAPQPSDAILKKWAALAFSAGPGTGKPVPNDEGECFRRYGSYAPQLQRSKLFRDDYGNPDHKFLSCTGSTTSQVSENQLRFVDGNTSLVTLSTGGNDVLFYNVLIACIFNPWNQWGDCDAALQNTTRALYSQDLWTNWNVVVSNISDAMGLTLNGTILRPPDRTFVYQTAYPPFFDSWTTQCNDAWFFPSAGPRLTNLVRERMDLAGQELNAALSYWIDEYNGLFERHRGAGAPSFIKFVNQDERYNGHRFCRVDVVEPDRNNNQTWFFNLLSKPDHATNESVTLDYVPILHDQQVLGRQKPDSEACEIYPQDASNGLRCVVAKATAQGELAVDPSSHSPLGSETVEKTFHPRYRGFKATTKELKSRFRYTVGPQSTFRDKRLRIMCIGDSIAVGIGEDAQHNSYRRNLNDLLVSAKNSVEFVGSQSRGDEPTNHVEGYLAARISDLHRRLRKYNTIATFQPNVIIVTAGSTDMRALDAHDYAGLNKTRQHLETFISYLFSQCQSCVILVGDIPSHSNTFSWPPSPRQRQALQFNAMISEVVNKIQTLQKMRRNGTTVGMVTKVHFTTAGKDIYADNGYPNNGGYLKMAYDIHERLWDANQQGWIHESPATQALPETDPSTSSFWRHLARFFDVTVLSNYLRPLLYI